MKENSVTIRTVVQAPVEKVWEYWNAPEHIIRWAFASDDWEATNPENDLTVGGTFKTTMGAKDGSEQFDFAGTYTAVEDNALIEYDMEDGRHVKIEFHESPEGIEIVETFELESETPEEVQRSGWQAILDNFKQYVEARV